METNYLPIIGGTYRYFDKGVSCQLMENLYRDDIESEGGKVQAVLRPFIGYDSLQTWSLSGATRGRGLYFSSNSKLWAVFGNKLVRINVDNTSVVVGEVSNFTTRVKIMDNGINLLVLDGTNAYKCDLTASDPVVATTFSLVTLPVDDFTSQTIKPYSGTWLNARFVIDSGYRQFNYSEVDSVSFPQLNFYDAESSPDPIVGLAQVQNRVYVLGTRSYEVWTMDGSNDDPMSPISGTASQIGCMAKDSIAVIADRVFWLGSSDAGRYMVFVGTGLGDPKRVSDNALEEWIQSLTQPSACEGFCFMDRGHTFYVMNFTADNISFAYDTSTDKWSVLSNRDLDTGRDIAFQPCMVATGYNGVLYAIGAGEQALYRMANDVYGYNGNTAIARYVTPVMWDTANPISLRELLVDMTTGYTLSQDPDSEDYDPECMIQVSLDGGNSFEPMEWQSFGRVGEYDLKPPCWHNLGRGRSIVVEIRVTNKVGYVIRGIRATTSRSLRR